MRRPSGSNFRRGPVSRRNEGASLEPESPKPERERSDAELVEAARGGELEAFDELMRRHQRLVYRVVFRFAGDADGALDLTQSAFLKAYRGLAGYRAEASFKSWVLKIAVREGLNWSRSARRARLEPELEADDERLARPAEQEDALVERERTGELRRALERLSARVRTALVLRYRDRCSIREIAAALDTSEAMTKNLLFRGVRQLRRTVGQAREA